MEGLLRKGPTLSDLGRNIRKKYPWKDAGIKGRIKGSNTLDFVKTIDDAWNLEDGISKSTEKEFLFPDWYLPGEISYNRK